MRTSTGAARVFPPQDLSRARLFADRREPPRRRPGAPAGDRHAWTVRGAAGKRAAGAAGAIGRALRQQGDGALRHRGHQRYEDRQPPHRAAGLRAAVGARAVIAQLCGARKHGFALERAVFLTVLHRLFVSGSDRAADRWREDYRIAGVDGLDLHHLYRAMAWLGEELPAKDQDGRTPFAPRCIKDLIEERLLAHRRDLFTRLDLVFMDTTSLYFEGAGGQTLGRYGYSKGPPARSAADDPRSGHRR